MEKTTPGQRGGSRMKAYQVPKGPPHLASAEGAGGVKWVRKGLSRGSSDPMIEASWQSGECKGRAAINGALHCHTRSHTYTHTHVHSHSHMYTLIHINTIYTYACTHTRVSTHSQAWGHLPKLRESERERKEAGTARGGRRMSAEL